MKTETKNKIIEIASVISIGSRNSLVDTIIKYSGDEFESNDDFISLAKLTEAGLKENLVNLIKYILDNE